MTVKAEQFHDIAKPPTVNSTSPRTWLHRIVAERLANQPTWVLIAELFLALGWLRAAVEKLIEPAWWSGTLLREFVAAHGELALGWYEPFLDLVVLPRAAAFAFVVMVLQAMVGISLLTGRQVPMGLGIGMFLNLHFVAAGAVNPSAFYLVIQGVLALWLAERSTRRLQTGLRVVATTMVAMALMSLPFIDTLAPAAAVHDPALMFLTLGGLTLLGCDQVHRAVTAGEGLP